MDWPALEFHPTECCWEGVPQPLQEAVKEISLPIRCISLEDLPGQRASFPRRPLLTYREGKLGVWQPSGLQAEFFALDWTDLAGRWSKRPIRSGPLFRATRSKSLEFVVDATTGSGKDALFLSSMGHQVKAYERDPVVYLLLFDAHYRLLQSEVANFTQLARRISLSWGDVRQVGNFSSNSSWAFFYDPMYTSTGGKGARKRDRHTLPRKDMQLLRWREKAWPEQEGQDEILHVLQWACDKGGKPAILKRPLKAPKTALNTANLRLENIFKGKTTRY